MGYLGCDGSLDLNILIRTLAVSERGIEFRTGAGIVADSHPQRNSRTRAARTCALGAHSRLAAGS
jgi:anthranilate synthase component 1